MSENQPHLRGNDPLRTSSTQLRAPSIVQRIAGSQMTSQPTPPSASRIWIAAVVTTLAVGVGCAWTLAARSQLNGALADESAQHLRVAQDAFAALRAQTQANLVATCRVLVEDPRLKSTLATEGMDAATVADILRDLAKLRRSGLLLVLSPDGRVFAQANAPELEGLDLSASSIVKKARESDDAAVGSWVLAGKVMDLSMKSVRYGDTLVAYLVVGQPVDEAVLASVEAQTGVSVASALGNKVVMASTKDAAIADVFARVVGEAGGATPHVVAYGGQRYVASVVESPETAQAHRLVLVSSIDPVAQRVRALEWTLFVPPVLVLLAMVLALSTIRSPRRIT